MSQNNKNYKRNNSRGKGKNYSKSGAYQRGKDPKIANAIDNRESLDSIKSNDIKWYNRSPLYPLATRIPFNQVMGANAENQFTGEIEYAYSDSIPGLMTIDFIPTIGWASDMNSAVNRAYNQLYADIVSKTNGALQMQQMELAIMTTGVSSVACHLGYAKKVMQTYQLYSSLNYYLPKPLITALGFDFDDLVAHAADYQLRLTDLINRFNRLAIPNFSDLHVRQYALSHNIYTDSETVFGQIFNFRPTVLYKFRDVDHRLEAVEIFNGHETITLNRYFADIEDALRLWENSSVTPIVAGNVRRAYPESSLVRIDPFDPKAKLTPIVDRNITWQINNMRWATVPVDSVHITQDPVANVLICKPQWEIISNQAYAFNAIKYLNLNSFDGNTSDEFIMESTRLIPIIEPEFTDAPEVEGEELKSRAYLVDCPSELITRVYVYNRVMDAEGKAWLIPRFYPTNMVVYNSGVFDASEDLANVLHAISDLTKWRNGPGFTLLVTDDWATPIHNYPIDTREISLFTHLHQDQLANLHLAASQSLFWASGFVPSRDKN